MGGNNLQCDVAIIGGGPGGSTAGSLLKKYDPDLSVCIFERETFPREHVGESQLPPISDILAEMGCWDKVEAADFPIKIGVTYRWGKSKDLWDFEFLPLSEFKDEPRPALYEGQRRRTAFQVDRAVYDKILLDHAAELGCDVREATKVASVQREGDRVLSLTLADGTLVEAKHYIDASGGVGFLRRAMDIEIEEPTLLKNVAFWDYFENTEWAVSIGVGGTRVQVLSLPYGWMWFIPLGPTRTSIGLICPAEFYKQCGMSPEDLYAKALAEEPRIAELTKNATREGEVRGTKDWSFLAKRMAGENWMLVGESCGFADPILAAGLTLTQSGAREAAYTILELERGELEPAWLKSRYEEAQSKRIWQHIRFADFWYSANGQFTDLREFTRTLASEAGLELDAEKAFQWLSTGGFLNDAFGQAGLGGLDLAGVKQITQLFTAQDVKWEIGEYNLFRANLKGATEEHIPFLVDGRIRREPCWVRKGKNLPQVGLYQLWLELLSEEREIAWLIEVLRNHFVQHPEMVATPEVGLHHALQALEVMSNEGWVHARFDPRKPKLNVSTPHEGHNIHTNRDTPIG